MMPSLRIRNAHESDASQVSKISALDRRTWLRQTALATFVSWPCLVITVSTFYVFRLFVFPKLLFCNLALFASCSLLQILLVVRKMLKSADHASLGSRCVVERAGAVIGTFSRKIAGDVASITACDALLRRLGPSDFPELVDLLEKGANDDGAVRLRFEIEGASNAALRDLLALGFKHFKTERLQSFYPGVGRHSYHLEWAREEDL